MKLKLIVFTTFILACFFMLAEDAKAYNPGGVTISGNVPNFCYTLMAKGETPSGYREDSWYQCLNQWGSYSVRYYWYGMEEGDWTIIVDLNSVPGYTFNKVDPEGWVSNRNGKERGYYVTWNQNQPPPTVNFYPDSSSIPYNTSTGLHVRSNASYCVTGQNWSPQGVQIPANYDTTTGNLTITKTYDITCYNSSGGSTLASTTVKVQEPSPPSVSVSVSPSRVNRGENVTVSWSVSGNVTGCWGTGNWPTWSGQWLGTSGYSSTTTGGLTADPTTFGVRCEGPGGSDLKERSVAVIQPARPTASISASPASVRYNGTSVLTWSSTDATSCTAGGTTTGWQGPVETSSNGVPLSRRTTLPLTSSQTYTLTCTGPGGTSPTAQTTVPVLEPSVSITCEPSSIPYNSSAKVNWSSQNVSQCTVSPTGWAGTDNSRSTGNLTGPATYTYTVTCEP